MFPWFQQAQAQAHNPQHSNSHHHHHQQQQRQHQQQPGLLPAAWPGTSLPYHTAQHAHGSAHRVNMSGDGLLPSPVMGTTCLHTPVTPGVLPSTMFAQVPNMQAAFLSSSQAAASQQPLAAATVSTNVGMGRKAATAVSNSSGATDGLQRSKSPAPTTLYCDACEKEFRSRSAYAQHAAQHVKCDQCQFMASPKILAEHKRMAHAVKRKWPYTPDEVEKWRQERRKNYPTDSNVEQKKQQTEERQKANMVANAPTYKWQGSKRGYRPVAAGTASNAVPPLSSSSTTHDVEEAEATANGTASADHVTTTANSAQPTAESNQPGAATALTALACYGSDSEDEEATDIKSPQMTDAAQKQEPDSEPSAAEPPTAGSQVSKAGPAEAAPQGDFNDADPNVEHAIAAALLSDVTRPVAQLLDPVADIPDEVSSKVEPPAMRQSTADLPASTEQHAHGKRKREHEPNAASNRLTPRGGHSKRPKHRPSLLERMLGDEIRKEQNIVLQCIRYVVNNNFLQ